MLPYQLALAGLPVAPAFPLRLPFPVDAVFLLDSFSDLVEAVLSFLSAVFFPVSFFFAGVASGCDFFFSGVALGFGEAFFLGLGLGDGFGTVLGDGVGWEVAAGIWISLFAGVEAG